MHNEMTEEYCIKSRFWIASEGATFLGEGRVALLRAIDETGSISAAARELGISYRKAWKMIDIMNSHARKPLVERQSGGKRGGGTVVTDEGREMIAKYTKLVKQCRAYMDKKFKTFGF